MIDLEKILELEARATGAPWDEMHFDTYCCAVGPECVEQKQARKDQDLINLMRNNIHQICLELQAARACVEYLEASICFADHGDICRCYGCQLIRSYDEVTNGKG